MIFRTILIVVVPVMLLASVRASALPPRPATIVEKNASLPPVKVTWRQQLLSVNSADTPLSAVMAEVVRETGLRVEGGWPAGRRVQTHFSNLPLYDALAHLLSGLNFAIVESCRSATCPITVVVLPRVGTDAAEQHGFAQKQGYADAPDHRLNDLYQVAHTGDLRSLKRAASVASNDATQIAAMDLLAQKDPSAALGAALAASGSSDLGQRVIGLRMLARFQGPDAIKALGAALNDPDTGVKQSALASLAQQPSADAIGLIKQAAAADPDPTIQSLAKSLLETRNERNPGTPDGSGE